VEAAIADYPTCNVPTRVGVNRSSGRLTKRCTKCPHACGGEPIERVRWAETAGMSPRVWG